jgi:hypothetical protein
LLFVREPFLLPALSSPARAAPTDCWWHWTWRGDIAILKSDAREFTGECFGL